MKEINNLVVQYIKQHPYQIMRNVSFSLLYPVNDVVLPHIYGKVMSAMESKGNVLKPFVIAIIILVCVQIGLALSDLDDAITFPKLQGYVRQSMLVQLFNNYEMDYKEMLIGDLISKFVKIPHYLVDKYERFKKYVIPYIISYICAIGYFFYYDTYLGVGLTILVVVYLGFILSGPYTCCRISKEKDDYQNFLHEEIDDVLRNLISVYESNQKEEELNRLSVFERVYSRLYEKVMKCIFNTRLMVLPVIIGFLIFFMLRCLHQFKLGKMKSGKFVALFVILLYLLTSMMNLVDNIREMVFEEGTINSFDDEFNRHIVQRAPAVMMDRPEEVPGIYIHDVTYSYSNFKQPILQHFSMYVKPGEKVAIIGDIGCGKSTVLKLLLKLYEPSSGEIFLNGVPYSLIDIKQLRKYIGYVPQQPILFNRTILENIKYGNMTISDEQIEETLKNLGLEGEFSKLQYGLKTQIGKNGSKLSGGQRQLVWCLRVLLNNPQVLILDEPTASLDEKTKNLMKSMFDVFMQNRTVLMVTHDPYLMKYADRIIYIKKGQVVSDEKSK
jgi:ATP-binding cassette, subfamily B, bacterial